MTINGDNRQRQRKHSDAYTELGTFQKRLFQWREPLEIVVERIRIIGEMCMARENQMLREKGEPVAHRLTGVSTGR